MSWKECANGHGTYTDVRRGLSVIVFKRCLKRIDPGVVEIWGEVFTPQYYWENVLMLGVC